MKRFIRKNINIILSVLVVLNLTLVYFTFLGGNSEKSITAKFESEDGVIEHISVDYKVVGNPLSKVKITNLDDKEANINEVVAKVGSSFDISGNFSNAQLDEATITIKYDKDKLPEGTNEEDLSVFWYDEENNEVVKMPSKVNVKKSTVTMTTDHFSEYTLGDGAMWDEIWAKDMAKIREENSTFNVAFVVDDSGSMGQNDQTDKRLSSSLNAITSLGDKDKYSIIKFSSSATVIQDFTLDKTLASDALEEFRSSGGTNIVRAVEEGITLLKEENNDSETQKIIILLTDGVDSNLNREKETLIQEASQEDIIIFGIGLGDESLDFDAIKAVAEGTSGSFYEINSSELANIFEEITNSVVGVDGEIDTDSDGIPDGIETAGMRDQYGNLIVTNPYLADTDGDGKTDKEEIGELKYKGSGEAYYERVSHPCLYENNHVELNNVYPLGPDEDAIEVHDSGFRQNENGFSFRNYSYSGHGNCAGMAAVAEQIYNGAMHLTTNSNGELVYGYHLAKDNFRSLIANRNLYDFKLNYTPLRAPLGPDDKEATRSLDFNQLTSQLDYEMLSEINTAYLISNHEIGSIWEPFKKVPGVLGVFSLGDDTVSSNMVQKLSNIFDSGEIVTVTLIKLAYDGDKLYHGHDINAYAIQKMDQVGNEYRLYVYDNNYPYNPYYIADGQNGNTYITLRKNLFGSYGFEYAPTVTGTDNIGYSWNTADNFVAIRFSQNYEQLD